VSWLKVRDISLIAIFIITIWLPVLGFLSWPEGDLSKQEKRRLAPKPELKMDLMNLNRFPKQFDAYYKDHFGFRDQLIRWHNRFKLYFGVSPSERIVAGKQGWLFYRGEGAIEDYRNVGPLSPQQLEEWLRLLEIKRNRLAKKEIHFLFVVPPNKHTIYSEYLPSVFNKVSNINRLDQLIRYIEEKSDMRILDLRPHLLQEKKYGRIYHVTDTHWNHRGAHVAHQAILNRLYEWFPKEELGSRPELTYSHKQGNGGDLALMLGLSDILHEVRPIPIWKGQRCAQKVPVDLDSIKFKGGRAPFALACNRSKYRALIIHDSFGNALVPHIAESFNYSLFVQASPSAGDFDRLIDVVRPDVVIEIHVERVLSILPKQEKTFLQSAKSQGVTPSPSAMDPSAPGSEKLF
jgi:hypothetical protein